MAQSMVFASRLPLKLWEDAVEYAAFILNRIIFGSICSVSRDPRTGSLKQRSAIGVIIGVSDKTKGYCVFLQKKN
ncbi:unnamed protein product [Peronospora belbahrii]|uniref:Uncharacterized protein n=1 Tax=Peronospora belbahrii TaxID=622444 RepID=A0AAU9L3S9_9STRA|nr:unnamed protein product [Peronospora belbahrii]